MQSLFFWKTWAKDYRLLWYTMMILFVASITLLWIYYFNGSNNVINWEAIQEQKIVETTVHDFRLGPFNLSIPSESYVIFEYLGGSELHHNFLASYLFIGIVFFCVIILLSIVTTLEKFWYFAGMSIFILFVIALRLDTLGVFGIMNYYLTIGVLLIYLLISYYFRYVKTHTSFLIRVGTFLGITAILFITGSLFSATPSPILHLVVTCYTPAIFLSILFIIMVAHEILVSFVYITNQGNAGKNIGHFSLIGAIYLLYIIITYLHEVGSIHWKFLYIDLFLLLTISGILGIWGFKLRENLYQNFFPFAPFGAFFFIALGTICFITIAQLMGNANDAAIQVIRYIIIFTHAGFGIVFMIYFFSNFLVIMGNNLPVYNILYRPSRMPYFTFRFAGVIASLAFLFYSNWHSFVDHGVAGFYNYAADMNWVEGNEAVAQNFYEQSKNLSFQNHRANYMLATIKSERMNFDGAAANYRLANGQRPSEFSLANEGNLNFWTGQYVDGLAVYRKTQKVSPRSAVIQNNLGFAYAKVHNLDSASYYLSAARESEKTKTSAEANFLAMAAIELIPINADSILNYFKTESPSVQANAIAIATLFHQKIATTANPLKNPKLNLYTATLLNNYINYNVKNLDTTFLGQAYKIAADSMNFDYQEALKASLAHAYYHNGKVYKALEILGELAYITQNYQGKFNYIMGLWALDQGSPPTAVSYFSHAETSDYRHARFYKAIALTEAQTDEAIMAWDTLIARNEQPFTNLATNIKKILQANPTQALSFTDGDKYQFCRYRLGLKDTVLFNKLLSTFSNDNYKAQALLDISKRFYRTDKIIPAIQFFNRTTGLDLTDKKLYEELRYFELLMLASRKEISSLAKQINNNIEFDHEHQLEKLLYTALINESSGNIKEAEKIYAVLSRANPFFEEGILASANFYRTKDAKSIRPYDILVDAIYVNPNSIRLLKAYAAEAQRMGFDDYAASAASRLKDLE
jgi:hypothetical protein